MNMIDTKISPQAQAEYMDDATKPTPPEYSYGTRVCLDKDMLEKLGFKELPAIGVKFTMHAEVEVVGTSQHESNSQGGGNVSKSMDLQITAMGLTPAASSDADKVKGMYPTMTGSPLPVVTGTL
jgi:hypothetical protein